jgi:uncharacterized membrane protein
MLVSPYSRLSEWLHWLFEASLLIKGTFAAGETLSGLGLLLTPHGMVLAIWALATNHHLTQDANDAMALWFRTLATSFPGDLQHFYALYLLAHGALKFTMVIMLARRTLWGYPAAMLVLAGFVVYQGTEFVTQGSMVLLTLAALDAFMILLVYREWTVLKLQRSLLLPSIKALQHSANRAR